MAKRQARAILSQPPFIKIYQDFLESGILRSCQQKLIFIYLKMFADAEGKCFISVKKLAKLTKICISKVKNTLNELVQMGLIDKERRTRLDGGDDSNLYTIYDSSEIWTGEAKPDEKRRFIKVYRNFLENSQLDSCYQKLVYIYLQKFANKEEQCYPSVKTLAGLSKICVSKVKSTINELIQKGMINKKNRWKKDGGKSSNLYTLLYNLKEKLHIGKNKKADNHINIENEKGPDSEPAKVKNQAPLSNNIDDNYTKPNPKNCQEFERYSLEFIQKHFDYDVLTTDKHISEDDLDAVMNVLYDTLNTEAPIIRVSGDNKPSQVVISQLLKMRYWTIEYAIDQYKKQDEQRIKNPKAYMRSILYNAATGGHDLAITNQVAYNTAHWHENPNNPENQWD